MSNAKFIVSHLDQQIGPFSEEELRIRFFKGDLLPIDYIYDEKSKDWVLFAERFPWAKAAEPNSPPTVPMDAAVLKRTAAILNKSETATNVSIYDAPPAPPIAPASRAPSNGPIPQIHLVNGQAEIDIPSLIPGHVELALQASDNLKMTEPFRIQVKPVDPVMVTWAIDRQKVVGQEVIIVLKALDHHGNVCLRYSDEFTVQIRGPVSRDLNAMMKDGEAIVRLENTKAETWNLSLHYNGQKNIHLPASCTLEWLPGPAVRLVVDGPQECTTGSPVKLQIKAVDVYGNLATSFQGTVAFDVKAG